MTEALFFWAAVFAYTAVSILFWIAFVFSKERVMNLALIIVWVGLILHSVAIVILWAEVGHGPYISRYEVLTSNAWVLVAVYLASQYAFRRIRPVGAIVLPVGLIMMGFASIYTPETLLPPQTFKSNWLIVHIVFAKIATGSFCVATGLSVFYLLKSGKVSKRVSAIYDWLPRPDVMDELIYKIILMGFFALTVMVAAGSLWARQSWGRYWGWDPIETWSLLTWLVYAIYLHLRRTLGWRGKKTALFSIGAFLLVLIFAFGITTFLESIHSYYFVE